MDFSGARIHHKGGRQGRGRGPGIGRNSSDHSRSCIHYDTAFILDYGLADHRHRINNETERLIDRGPRTGVTARDCKSEVPRSSWSALDLARRSIERKQGGERATTFKHIFVWGSPSIDQHFCGIECPLRGCPKSWQGCIRPRKRSRWAHSQNFGGCRILPNGIGHSQRQSIVTRSNRCEVSSNASRRGVHCDTRR